MTIPPVHHPDYAVLDNPIWNSLTTGHAHLALGAGTGHGLARRYPADVGPLSGLRDLSSEAFADLVAVIPEGDIAVLFLEEIPAVPSGWQILRGGTLVQMLCPSIPNAVPTIDAIVPLEPADYAEVLALATLTEPGPFRTNTAALGGFLGIRVDGRLAAMAGRRLSPGAFVEVSAVCTHPDFRGRGYARALVAAVTRNIYADGLTPFLTAFEANVGAIRVYEQVGFSLRRTLELQVMKPLA